MVHKDTSIREVVRVLSGQVPDCPVNKPGLRQF